MVYIPDIPPPPSTKRRGRNIIWYNPPYSIDVKTNVAKKFLKLLDRHFPKGHKLHKLFNRNNVKVSYSCLPNIASIINSHNKKIISDYHPGNIPDCNCRAKDSCPLSGKCRDHNLIYCANVNETEQDNGNNYIGLTEHTIKDRIYKHRNSFKYESKVNSTELSKHVWDLKKNGITDPAIKWSIIDHAKPYINGSKRCHLCLTEKFHIITSPLNLLNKRSELVSKCRHENKYHLSNYKAFPPDS